MTQKTISVPLTLLAAPIALLALSGCASIDSSFASAVFSEFHGSKESFRGEGGKNTQIDGLDIWQDSFPNRRYRILGTITAKGYSEEARLAEAVATARGYHADALIVMNSYSKNSASNGPAGFSGSGGSGMGFAGGSFSVPLERPESMYLAIEYTRH